MRILIFSTVYYPRFIGGAEVAVKEITDRISPGEIEFDMVTLNGGSEPANEKLGPIEVHRIFDKVGPVQKLLFPLAAFFKAVGLNRERRYDATWSIMANRAGFAALFFKLTHPRIPFILTLQEGDPLDYPRKRAGIAYPLFKYIFRKADHITALSNFLADWARSMGAKSPITVVPNGADYGKFSARISDADIVGMREKLGKNPDDIFLITTSRLVEKNAVGDVIESLRYLPPSIRFLILGQGEDEKALRQKVAELKLGDRVIFAGHVDHEDMPRYLAASDIFVRPSLSEGQGASFIEAMAAGLPVIATAVGGIPDFLKDGETGLFCEVHNPRSIAQKVEKLLKDRESREYIVNNARRMVEEKYQWKGIALKMSNILAMRYNQTS
jgi:glycosyltransferase involved in cell wall biosynthesis